MSVESLPRDAETLSKPNPHGDLSCRIHPVLTTTTLSPNRIVNKQGLLAVSDHSWIQIVSELASPLLRPASGYWRLSAPDSARPPLSRLTAATVTPKPGQVHLTPDHT